MLMTKYSDVLLPSCKRQSESGCNIHTLRDEITPIYLTFQFHQHFIATFIRNTGEEIYGFYFLESTAERRNTLKFTVEFFAPMDTINSAKCECEGGISYHSFAVKMLSQRIYANIHAVSSSRRIFHTFSIFTFPISSCKLILSIDVLPCEKLVSCGSSHVFIFVKTACICCERVMKRIKLPAAICDATQKQPPSRGKGISTLMRKKQRKCVKFEESLTMDWMRKVGNLH